MADNDDIERILREIDAMDSGRPASPPAKRKDEVGKPEESGGSGSRVTWAMVAGAGGGVTGLVVGSVLWFLPYVSTLSTGVGAAVGGAVVGLVSGPPGWYRK